MEKSSSAENIPIAKAAFSILQDHLSSSFAFPGWNKGRIVCQRSQLKRILSGTESLSEGSKSDMILTLSNAPFHPLGASTSMIQTHAVEPEDRERKKSDLLSSTV